MMIEVCNFEKDTGSYWADAQYSCALTMSDKGRYGRACNKDRCPVWQIYLHLLEVITK